MSTTISFLFMPSLTIWWKNKQEYFEKFLAEVCFKPGNLLNIFIFVFYQFFFICQNHSYIHAVLIWITYRTKKGMTARERRDRTVDRYWERHNIIQNLHCLIYVSSLYLNIRVCTYNRKALFLNSFCSILIIKILQFWLNQKNLQLIPSIWRIRSHISKLHVLVYCM